MSGEIMAQYETDEKWCNGLEETSNYFDELEKETPILLRKKAIRIVKAMYSAVYSLSLESPYHAEVESCIATVMKEL